MGTENEPVFVVALVAYIFHVKLNTPLMGTEIRTNNISFHLLLACC